MAYSLWTNKQSIIFWDTVIFFFLRNSFYFVLIHLGVVLQSVTGMWEGERRKGTIWAKVQVENVSTCVVREADINDFGVLLSSARSYPSSPLLSQSTACKTISVPLSFPYFYGFAQACCCGGVLTPPNTGQQIKGFKWLIFSLCWTGFEPLYAKKQKVTQRGFKHKTLGV